MSKPQKCLQEPFIIVEGQCLIQQYGKFFLPAQDFRRGHAKGKVNLFHGSAAELIKWDQFFSGVKADIKILINYYFFISAVGNAGKNL